MDGAADVVTEIAHDIVTKLGA
jgi:hypothetical protein